MWLCPSNIIDSHQLFLDFVAGSDISCLCRCHILLLPGKHSPEWNIICCWRMSPWIAIQLCCMVSCLVSSDVYGLLSPVCWLMLIMCRMRMELTTVKFNLLLIILHHQEVCSVIMWIYSSSKIDWRLALDYSILWAVVRCVDVPSSPAITIYSQLSYGFPSVLWCCWLGNRKGIRPVKTLHQNLLAMVVNISGWDTGCITLWQPHLPVNITEGHPANPDSPENGC